MSTTNRDELAVWAAYVRAALALGLVGGFGLGGALFVAVALRLPLGAWWVAAAQAHGQLQLLGWAGLTVLGVALHFLPRLRGATPTRSALARPALALLVAGLALRLACQPLLATPPADWARLSLRFGLALAGLLGLLGATLALGDLGRALASGPPLQRREGFLQVAPFLLVAFGSFWAAHALTGVALAGAAWQGVGVLDARLDRASVLLASYGFLLPICIGMSARLFPLQLRTTLPRHGALRAALACTVVGLALRATGLFWPVALDGVGQLLLATSIALAIVGLGIVAPRRQLPRAMPPVYAEPIQVAALSSYGWLAVTAALLTLSGLATLGLPVPTLAGETHAFGAGFVTILILGVGAALFPGFARRPLRSQRLLWLILLAANTAALARVAPLWFDASLPPRLASTTLAVAGLCGLVALLLFAANLAGPRNPSARPQTTGQADDRGA